MNNSQSSLNEVEVGDSSLLVAEGANPVAIQDSKAKIAATVDRNIKPFTLEGMSGNQGAARQPALMSQQPSLMAGGKGLGADIGADPQVASVSGMSESSSQTSLESMERNRLDKLGQSQTFGRLALQKNLAQNRKEKFE